MPILVLDDWTEIRIRRAVAFVFNHYNANAYVVRHPKGNRFV